MIHKLLAGKGKMKRGLSLLLCLALLGSSVISSNVTAEAESDVTTTATEEVTEDQATDQLGSAEETASETVTESITEVIAEASTEETIDGLTESISETTTEAESVSEEEIGAKTESNTLNLGSSTSATADDGISLTSVSGTTTVAVGSTTTLTTNVNYSGSWSSNDTSVATVSGNGKTVTVTGMSAGTVTIKYTYTDRWGQSQTDSTTVTVTGSGSSTSNTVTVYVYVAGSSLDGVEFSQDMLDLLGVGSLDAYGYFSAGTIELDMSQLSGTYSSKIKTQGEWDYVLGVLESSLDTTSSISNSGNTVASYANQVLIDTDAEQGNMYSGLWVSWGADDMYDVGGHVNANGTSTTNGQYRWHLDIRFNTVKITYIYGNNGITEGDERDGNTAVNGEKVYIQGATLDLQPTVTAPDGYKIAGYYTDRNFTTEWEDITGSPIDEDITVYIKLVPLSDVTINYVVQEGIGTVTDPSNYNAAVQEGTEYFNPVTENPVGSTAEAGDGYEFEGWYSDKALTNKVSSDVNYIPSAPTGGWSEGTEYTYYAKFVPVKTTVTVNKVWKDNENTSLRPSSVTVELYAGDEATGTTAPITSAEGWTYTFTDLNKYSYNDDGTVNAEIEYTVKENEVDGYTSEVTTGTDGNITVTNTLSTATVTLTKVVAGNMGVQSKKFTFSVSYTDASGAKQAVTYTLTGEEGSNTESFEVKLGTDVTVAETQEGLYVMSATVDGATETVSNNTVTVTVNGDSDIVVTNTYNATPDTGINLDSAPYIAILFGVVLLGTAVLIHRRRRLL